MLFSLKFIIICAVIFWLLDFSRDLNISVSRTEFFSLPLFRHPRHPFKRRIFSAKRKQAREKNSRIVIKYTEYTEYMDIE
jgi:hypothetical protein